MNRKTENGGNLEHVATSPIALEKLLLLLCADIAIIVGAARFFGWLFGRIGQPLVVGEILAGVILVRIPRRRRSPGIRKTRPRAPGCRSTEGGQSVFYDGGKVNGSSRC